MRTRASLISAGTERQIMNLASKSLVGKAKARPDHVRRVIDKVRTEGLWPTVRQVIDKLDQPIPMGYSASGVVEAVADDVDGISPGDRVAIAGAGYASHAEMNMVPRNLVARLPDSVSFEQAAYATVATIALQGVRLTGPLLGESVVVIGLGLVGLLTVQLLSANGCYVIGIDPNEERRRIAHELGVEAVASPSEASGVVDRLTGGRGADHTIITAATSSNTTVVQAGEVTRRQGSVVAVGLVGMDLPRDTFFSKELRFQVSMSYGPGRYDPAYEQGGVDYPYDYVRWTEGRNLGAVVDLMGQGRLDVDRLTTHTFVIADALDAYELIKNGDASVVGLVLTYPHDREIKRIVERRPARAQKSGQLGVSFIGAGNYAVSMLLPAVQNAADTTLEGLVTATGVSAGRLSEKFGFRFCGTDTDAVLNDNRTDVLFIATRHSTHAELCRRALESGKHVFVEKPMVTTPDELEMVVAAEAASAGSIMVGLNRRFAPMICRAKREVDGSGSKQIVYRVNSGAIPPDSWVQFKEEGGGMLVGEMIHFVDVMQFLTNERPETVYAKATRVGMDTVNDRDNVVVTIGFDQGSVGVLVYNTVGDRSAPKERIEVYGGGKVVVIDDFRRVSITKAGKTTTEKSSRQDKGQPAMIAALFDSIRRSGKSPVLFEELRIGMATIFAAARSLRDGCPVTL